MSDKIWVPEKIKDPCERDYGGTVVHKVPIIDPSKVSPQEFSDLVKKMTPLKVEQKWVQKYHHSYAENTPFFAGLSNGVLLGTFCPSCERVYVTPWGNCPYDGKETGWVQIKGHGTLHSYTVCYYAGEAFQDQTPFPLVYVEFHNIELPNSHVIEKPQNLLLSRLVLPQEDLDRIAQAQQTKDYSVIEDTLKIGMPLFPKFRRITDQGIIDLYFVRGVPLEQRVE